MVNQTGMDWLPRILARDVVSHRRYGLLAACDPCKLLASLG